MSNGSLFSVLDRSVVEREIAGALASAIDAHGPITRATRASAAKRIVSALKALDKREGYGRPPCTSEVHGVSLPGTRPKVPVMVRGGRAHAPSRYRVYGEYETFEEAASIVQRLRGDDEYAWAYIPDEYAPRATS